MTAASQPQRSPQPPPPEVVQLLQLLGGRWVVQAIHAVAELAIPDLLREGPRSAEEIAKATNTRPDPIYRILRALASVGIFREVAPRRFALAPAGELLRSDRPVSLRASARMAGTEWEARAWEQLLPCLRSGREPFREAWGMPVFEYFAKNRAAAKVFDESMTNYSTIECAAVLEAYDFDGISKLGDVGGGHGFLLASILAKHPGISGVLYDLPQVVADAKPTLERAGVAARMEVVAGSFFEGAPRGCDAILMKHILHDWDDDRCVTILRHCADAIPKNGKVIAVDAVLEPGDDPHPAKFLDLQMLVMTEGGRERTREEFAKLFDTAGLRLARVVPTACPSSVIEAHRR